MEIERPDGLMMCWGMVFGVVIAEIGGSRSPIDGVLALVDAILQPVEAHV
jgi:hypothetical protein